MNTRVESTDLSLGSLARKYKGLVSLRYIDSYNKSSWLNISFFRST